MAYGQLTSIAGEVANVAVQLADTAAAPEVVTGAVLVGGGAYAYNRAKGE